MGIGAILGLERIGEGNALTIALVSCIALLTRRSTRRLIPVLFAFAVASSALRVGAPTPSPLAELARAVPRCEITGRVVESHGGLGTLVSIEDLRCEHADARGIGGVAIASDLEVDPGSSLQASGWLLPLRETSFDRARHRTGAVVELDITGHRAGPPANPVHRTSAFLRSSLRDATEGLPDRRAGLLRGLAIGDTALLDARTEDLFRRSGLSHLVAVSGSNVAVVVGAVALATLRLGLRWRVAASLVALALYIAVVGPDPSVLRAGAMGTLVLVAVASSRTAEPLATLGIAVIVCVGFRPELAAAPGLHLSVAATAGIVIGAKRLQGAFAALPGLLATVLSVTLAAQIAVAPILIATFGELSVVAPLANLAAVPAVAPATILTLLAGLVARVLPQLVPLLVVPAELCARWILACADLFGGIAGASVALPTWVALLPLPVLLFAGLRAYKVTTMSSFHWRTLDAEGNELSRSEDFDSKEAAEAWMGAEWKSLLEQGGHSVSLRSDDDEIYEMSLHPA